MLTQETIDKTVARLAQMPFFQSSDKGARATITEEIINMATSDEQVIWLGHRMLQLYPKQWPGIVELRACFCKRFKPADGVQVNSSVYFDEGFPSEAELGPIPGLLLEPSRSERQAIEAADQPKLLPDGQEFTADPELEKLVHELATEKAMPVFEKRTKEQIESDLYRPRITPEEVETARQMEMLRRQTEAK